MKETVIGRDFVTITESNIVELSKRSNEKIHLIKFNFDEPTREKILSVIDTFTKTNRYIISNNIKIYNDVLKTTGKKYYIENEKDTNLISYLRKNNKILLNFDNLRKNEQELLLDEKVFVDLLKNVEVIQVDKRLFTSVHSKLILCWDGNIIFMGE